MVTGDLTAYGTESIVDTIVPASFADTHFELIYIHIFYTY